MSSLNVACAHISTSISHVYGDTRFLCALPQPSGMLENKQSRENDCRSISPLERRRSWVLSFRNENIKYNWKFWVPEILVFITYAGIRITRFLCACVNILNMIKTGTRLITRIFKWNWKCRHFVLSNNSIQVWGLVLYLRRRATLRDRIWSFINLPESGLRRGKRRRNEPTLRWATFPVWRAVPRLLTSPHRAWCFFRGWGGSLLNPPIKKALAAGLTLKII